MKKPLLIIFGIIIIVILAVVWGYLLFFAKAEDNVDMFNNLVNGGAVDNAPLLNLPNEEDFPVNLERPPLRQLTTRPVAGFNEVIDDNGNLEIYFVEMGTGHLYSINSNSGEERRLSGTTIIQAREAYISDDGNTVAIVNYNNTKIKNLSLLRLDRENSTLIEVITDTVLDFYLKNNYLFFTSMEGGNLVAYAYELDTLNKKTVFTLPFSEARIQWGESIAGPHYAYPKASYALEGFLYKIEGSKLTRLPLEGFGFSALVEEETILFTKLTDQAPMSYFYNQKTNEIKALNQTYLPEKCLLIENALNIMCPYDPNITLPYQMPDIWYQGKLSFADRLLLIDLVTGTSNIFVDILSASGREIDVMRLSYDANFKAFFFTNKNDNSLWMYENNY
ncbi:MAG TPA: hypothetical protein PKD95_00230 [Candidatus Paceibacterota bacterium]|nr:hypothetical protein [Candidatus Paceibacterota bacterium]